MPHEDDTEHEANGGSNNNESSGISEQLNTAMVESRKKSVDDLQQQVANMTMRIEALSELLDFRNDRRSSANPPTVTSSNNVQLPLSMSSTSSGMSIPTTGYIYSHPTLSQTPMYAYHATATNTQISAANVSEYQLPYTNYANLYYSTSPNVASTSQVTSYRTPSIPLQPSTLPYAPAPVTESYNNVVYSSYQQPQYSSSSHVPASSVQSTQNSSSLPVSAPPNPSQLYVDMPPRDAYGNRIAPADAHYGGRRKLHDLPEFYGRPEEWPMFISMFRESSNAFRYSNLENMLRLQKSLKGKARETVESLLIYPDNIEEAVAQLEFQFGRPECLIRSQISLIRGLASINDNHLEQIIPFAIKVKNFASFLQTSNGILHLANPMLMEELLNKLPMSKRIEWAQYSANIQPFASIIDFSNWINQVARLISTVVIPSSASANPQRNETGKASHAKNKVVLHATKSQPAIDVVCSLCEKSHLLTSCEQFNKLPSTERWEHVKAKRLCFSCLKPGHGTFNCRKRRSCGVDGCRRSHNALLHDTDVYPSTASASSIVNIKDPEPSTSKSTENKSVLSCNSEVKRLPSPASKVLFKVVPVRLFGPKKSIDTFALLDDGSAVTMMDENLARDLELPLEYQEDVNLQWFGDLTVTQKSSIVNVGIRGKGKRCVKLELQNVRTIKGMELPVQSLSMQELTERCQHIRNLPVFDYSNAKPRILIGLDNSQLGVSRQVIMGENETDPIVVKTKLGWVLYGPSPSSSLSSTRSVLLHQSTKPPAVTLESLHEIVKDYFTTENFGVKRAVPVECDADARARAILEKTTVRIGQKFETGLLWRDDVAELPDSFNMALKRLQSTERRMRAVPEYGEAYIENIRQYIEKGYARKLTPEEASRTSPRTWYLPHFGVKNPSKPKKLRLVFDAAAEVDGVSLNSALLTGPDLNQPLTAILHKFRVGNIAVCGDIREMFHQVSVRQDDQNSQRFLWRDGDSQKPAEIYVMVAMTFGATCSPCSAQYVKNKNAREFADTFPEAVDAIINLHYVDDYVASFQSEVEAKVVTKSVIDIHKHGGFQLRNFVSNCRQIADEFNEVKESVAEAGKIQSVVDMNLTNGTAAEKILGMFWDTDTDEFKFQLKFHRVKDDVLTQRRCPTKREVLSHAMSIFDPFGFLADFVIYAKLIIQNVWKSGVNWDESIPDQIYICWKAWQLELQKVAQFRIPRCYSHHLQDASDLQLHIFVDASESAFAAVAYLRLNASDDKFQIAFVSGKTKCAPQKLLSVPRLELQAAVMGVRLHNSIVETHNFNFRQITFWSDSNTVIQWIRSDHRRYKPFVAHRIAEILASTDVSNWRWIPTKLNCADDATRAKYPPIFEPQSRWLHGPQFLQCDEASWPKGPKEVFEECQEEMRPRSCLLLLKRAQVSTIFSNTYLSHFSHYLRAVRITAWWRRYIRNLTMPESDRRRCSLLVSEVNDAEYYLCRTAQKEAYPDEYDDLVNSRTISKASSLFQLSPCLNEVGVITVSGRIDVATFLPLSTRRPMILPRKHPLTTLIIDHYHRQYHHQNQGLIISEIRRKFWIPHLGSLVRDCKTRCQSCKVQSCQPATPMMGQLPIDRLKPFVRPFTYTGFDYFGPVFVTIGRRREKRWVALFTCLTIRAIHLELAADLSTDSCLLCINNFVNRRGLPVRIRSDNGTNFVGADRELREAIFTWDQDRIANNMTTKGIEWLFNCPANPSAGGCWERMVRTVKRVLLYTVKEVAPRVETLRSLLIEAENIVNSRPLTHIPISHEEEEPLTPNHFLLGTANSVQTPCTIDFHLLDMRKQWRISQQLKDCFWRRWIRDFLPTLTRRTKWHQKAEPLKVDDLVFICETDERRRNWSRGRIVRVYTANDGQVRSADVKTAGGVLRRPVSKLAVLDVSKSPQSIYEGRSVADAANNRTPQMIFAPH